MLWVKTEQAHYDHKASGNTQEKWSNGLHNENCVLWFGELSTCLLCYLCIDGLCMVAHCRVVSHAACCMSTTAMRHNYT